MLEGCQRYIMIKIEFPALHECPGTVIIVSERSQLISISGALGYTYPNSNMRDECNLVALVSKD